MLTRTVRALDSLLLLPALTAACAHGQLSGRGGAFEAAEILFPESYVLCDRGEAHACSRLAFALSEWSTKPRLAEAIDLHAMACNGGISESRYHLDMLQFDTNPSARLRMARRVPGSASARHVCSSEQRLAKRRRESWL